MGKPEGEQALPSTSLALQGNTRAGVGNGCCFSCPRIRKWVNCRCILVLVLGCAVFLSAVFWLPFFHSGDRKALDLEYQGYDIVASFMLTKPAFYLKEQKSQLQEDIFNEISFSSTEVQILSLQPVPGQNSTVVIFAVKADSTTQSLIRSSFVSLVTGQSSLHLTASLFGDPISFEILKFKGGITVSPVQKAFPLQSVQILFNFTLNFSVDEILANFDQLSNQLRKSLHLASYENLYISLTNQKGSTIDPPTKVISEVFLAVGINPSQSRLKQLAQTIIGSHSKNLGLNNTVFGRVKQISLSSVLQHSLGPDGNAPSPSPSYPSASKSHHHHHDHNHNHYHHHDSSPAPSLAPLPLHGGHIHQRGQSPSASAPAPVYTGNRAPSPQPCHHGGKTKLLGTHKMNAPLAPSASPSYPNPRKPPPINPTPAPVASPQNPGQASGDSPQHASPLVPAPGVSQLPSTSSVNAIIPNSWALLLFTSTALLFIAS